MFSRWGGIPRFDLEKAHEEIQQALLDEAILKCQVDILLFNSVSIEKDSMNHNIVHVYTNTPDINNSADSKPYTEKLVKFAFDSL